MKQIDDAINEKFVMEVKRFKKENPEKDIKDLPIENLNIYKSDKKPASQNPLDFSEEEDQFIAFALFKYGYGSWELIRNELRNSHRFIFNWAVKCRTNTDIQKRCDYLV